MKDSVSRCLRQLGDYLIVGVMDHFAYLVGGDTAIELDRVPVSFVEMVTGGDRRIPLPQKFGEYWLALETDARAIRLGYQERKNTPGDFVDIGNIPEGMYLGGLREVQGKGG
jgi:hypothetical protein